MLTRHAAERERERLEEWLGRGFQGEMRWMERDPEKRTDPRALLPDAVPDVDRIEHQRLVRLRKLTTSEVDSQLANVLAGSTCELFAKHARQVDRVNVYGFSHTCEGYVVMKLRFQNFSRAVQPAWPFSLCRDTPSTR